MNVYDTANRLAAEIKNSEEYVNFKMAKQAIALKADLKKQIDEFELARYEAQILTMQTGKADEEKMKKVQELYAKLIQEDDAKKYFDASIEFVLFFSIPVVVGLILVGFDLCKIYLGNSFTKSGQLLQLLSITVLFVSIANVVRTQYLIPMSKDKTYIISTVLGAVINFILNIIFIQLIGVSGACIGTIVAELYSK